MVVRRVVTGVDEQGRSTVVSDGDAFGGDAWGEVWSVDPTQGVDALADPHEGPTVLDPPVGGLGWRVFSLPPDAVMRARLRDVAAVIPGMEPDGFHVTETVDLVMVLDGDISLELDTGEVALHTGDCVVQRGTRHAWRNRGDRPVRMMAVMLSTRTA